MTTPQQRLEQMLVATINAREAESARVGRLLHDEVGQVLSAVGLQLEGLRLDFQDRVPDIGESIATIQGSLEQAVVQVRDLSYSLNSAVVERIGLHYALERLVGRLRESCSCPVRLFYELPGRPSVTLSNALYRIAEQALQNAVSHSQATQIQIVVKGNARSVTLTVQDNGVGLSADGPTREGLGLALMEFSAAQVGLALSVVGEPGQGTTVTAAGPLA